MAIVGEKWNGRHQTVGENPQQENEYLIFQAVDDTDAQQSMLAYVPQYWSIGNFVLPIQTSEITERLTVDMYAGRVVWAWNPPQEEGDELISFDTSGGNAKILQSLQTMGRYAAPGFTAPDFKGAIGVTEDGIEGVEVPIPALQFSLQRRFSETFVTNAYIKTLSDLTGCVNNAVWKSFPAGEVRFDGASGQQKIGKPWDITFKFTRSKNVTGLTVGPITGVAKKGWEYLWIRHRKTVDGTAQRLIQVPLAAYVEKVLYDADFAALGLNIV